MAHGKLSFPNPRPETARWEVNTKSQQIKKGIGKRGLPTKFKVEILNDCREDGAGKWEKRPQFSALGVPGEHVKLNLIYATRSRACFSLFLPLRGGLGFASLLPFVTTGLG